MTRDLPSAIEWEPEYSSHTHNLVKDFYIPILSNTIIANRCIGYFFSSALAAASVGYEKFCEHPDAKMRLIVGLQFAKDDHDRILYSEDPEKIEEGIRDIIESELTKDMPDFEKSRLAGLSWMLANGKMEIKFGVMLDFKTKKPLHWEVAKFHHKITTFTDASENSVSISGSINESEAAWTRNGDSFGPDLSWEGGWTNLKVDSRNKLFEEIWNTDITHSDGWNRDLNVGIFSISDLPEHFKRYSSPVHPSETMEWPNFDDTQHDDEADDDDPRWIHQGEAVRLFLEDRDSGLSDPPKPAGKQGILCMATGTGKTRTALKIVKEMIDSGEVNKIIITTHKKDLLNQWSVEMADPNRGLDNLINARFKHYGGSRQSGKFIFSRASVKSILIGRSALQKLLLEAREGELDSTLLIVDECHNFRGDKHRSEMQDKYSQVPYRLGLSATPQNEYDSSATQFLFDEIGPIYYNFDLLDAILKGILCPFEYYPEDYTPTAAEIAETAKIRRKFEGAKKQSPGNAPQIHKTMLMEIAKVYKKSEGKLPVLRKLLGDKSILQRCIIFGPEKEFNSKIKEMLNNARGVNWTPYYGETDKKQLDLYRSGKVEVLLTCKAIAEGMDLDVSNIILLSSDGTKLQTIQRIGRALRTHGDQEKVARVYDFIRDNAPESADTKRRDWLDMLGEEGLKSRIQEEE